MRGIGQTTQVLDVTVTIMLLTKRPNIDTIVELTCRLSGTTFIAMPMAIRFTHLI